MPRRDEHGTGPQRPLGAPLPQAELGDEQRLACLRLIRSENVGPVTFRELINRFGGAAKALDALPDLARRGGRSRPIRIYPRDAAEAELAAAARIGCRPVFTIEPGYPQLLAGVDVPPPVLYIKGRGELLGQTAVAIVGSRNSSAAGTRLTQGFAERLGHEGIVVVSGLARGIDAAAHRAALATGTVAVLAGGLDFIYPPEHRVLHELIAEQGCLVSEQPPGFQPRAQDFPRRNRIISGISLAVLIVEAARRSGTLITARTAAEQGREVMAVPGHPLDPRAEGTNALIRERGATMITTADEMMETLQPMRGAAIASLREPTPRALSDRPAPSSNVSDVAAGTHDDPAPGDAARVVRDVLGPAPSYIDDIVRATGLPVQSVRAALLELSLSGEIEQHGRQLVSLRSGEPPTS